MFKSIVNAKGSIFFSSAKIFNLSGKKEAITIGENSVIKGELLVYKSSGSIEIGEYCFLGENSRIWSLANIIIGNRVLISHDVNIHDNNSHPINLDKRHAQFRHIVLFGHPEEQYELNEKPIIIEDDVWIGFNTTINKGVKIGKGAIIAPASVITNDVPPFVLVGGNPMKIIRKL